MEIILATFPLCWSPRDACTLSNNNERSADWPTPSSRIAQRSSAFVAPNEDASFFIRQTQAFFHKCGKHDSSWILHVLFDSIAACSSFQTSLLLGVQALSKADRMQGGGGGGCTNPSTVSKHRWHRNVPATETHAVYHRGV